MPDPTVADVFNQLVLVNGKLDAIDTNTFGQANAINNLSAAVNNGFNKTEMGLHTIAKINVEIAKLAFHITQQNDTMICALDNISKNTCAILNEAVKQTTLQTSMAEDLDLLAYVAEFEHSDAVLDRKRQQELERKIERCCPTEQPRPACVFQPCPKPQSAREPELPRLEERPKEPGPVG